MIEATTQNLLQYGALGIFVVVLLVAVSQLSKYIKELVEQGREDRKLYICTIETTNEVMMKMTNELISMKEIIKEKLK